MAYHEVLATHKILILPPLADNLPPTETPFLALPDHAVVTLEGPDSTAFAQAQFANDVVALAAGQWQWNAWLTPKGRVIAQFALAKRGDDRLLVVLPDYPADRFVSELQRFVFRRKLKIAVHPLWRVAGAFAAPARARGAHLDEIENAIEFDLGGEGGSRLWHVGAAEASADAAALSAWRAADLRHGLPRLPESQRGQWTPQQLSLDRLRAYSVKKGCYPGQEIVARTHFLGKAKRNLVLLASDAPLASGAKVGDGERDIGDIVCVEAGPPAIALAVVPLERAQTPLVCAGQALRELPLLGGLER